MAKELDTKDWRLLQLLCENARYSNNKLGQYINTSANAVTYKIERLERMKVISCYSVILNQMLIGINLFGVLIKVNATLAQEEGLEIWITEHKNIMVADKLLGEWDYNLEIGVYSVNDFNSIIQDLKSSFSHILMDYEVHLIQYGYKVEQLPLELISELTREVKGISLEGEPIKLDNTEKKLLFELNKSPRTPLHILAKKIGLTYETISKKIKELTEKGVILKTSANINLGRLGYDFYLLNLKFKNLSEEREKELKTFILDEKRVRYSYMSGSKPNVLLYLAVKNSAELGEFMKNAYNRFPNVIENITYMLSTELIKYNLFPEGFI